MERCKWMIRACHQTSIQRFGVSKIVTDGSFYWNYLILFQEWKSAILYYTRVLISPYPDHEGNKLMFVSEWREFPSAPCRARKETWWQLASRFCWNRARLWHASELVSFLVGLRTYQHPGYFKKYGVTNPAPWEFMGSRNNIFLYCSLFRILQDWTSFILTVHSFVW